MTEQQPTLTPRVCIAELLCETPPALAENVRDAIVADITACLGTVNVLRNEEHTLHIALEDHLVEYEDGKKAPVMFMLMSSAASGEKTDPEKLAEGREASLSQTWNWPDAAKAVANAPHMLQVLDFMAGGLAPALRIDVFQKVLYAVATHVPCAALHFPLSQCMVDPEEYRANAPHSDDCFPLLGLVNVRLFTVRDREGEIVMDSLGLNVFGLPDVQCHCADVDESELAAWLFSLALYIATTEKEIDDGDTIDGYDGTKLAMYYEESLVEPPRVVIDLRAPEDEE